MDRVLSYGLLKDRNLIYITSFLRRLQVKSSCYFALPLTLLALIYLRDLKLTLMLYPAIALGLFILSRLILWFDKRRKTDIECPMCNYEHSVLLYPKKVRKVQAEEKGSYACSSFDHGHYPNVYFCPVCKNGFLETVRKENIRTTKDEGHKLYEEVEDELYIDNINSRYLTYKKIGKKYVPYFKDKDVLEIGSYYGVFYEEARHHVKSYTGIEPSKHACNYLKNKHPDVELINNNLEDALKNSNNLEGKQFDTVVMWDVIEHLPNPIETLKILNSVIKKDGHIIFSTINMESSLALATGPFWPWIMDMHYYYFSDRGYVDMLHRSGYTLKLHHHFSYYVYCSYFIEKVLSLTLSFIRVPQFILKKLRFSIPIQLGDTVLVIGKKDSY